MHEILFAMYGSSQDNIDLDNDLNSVRQAIVW